MYSVNVTVRESRIEGNKRTTGGTGIDIGGTDGLNTVSGLVVRENEGNLGHSVGLHLIVNVKVIVDNLQAIHNTATMRSVLFLDIATGLTLTNSTLEGNSGYRGGAIYADGAWRLNITNTVFKSNHALTNTGGAIDFTPYYLPPVRFYISNCRFEGNTAYSAGAIFIGMYSGGVAYEITIKDTEFAYNQAERDGSSIVTQSTVQFTDGTRISGCGFRHEKSTLGVISLMHVSGKVTVAECVFEECVGSTVAVLHVQTGDAAETYLIDPTPPPLFPPSPDPNLSLHSPRVKLPRNLRHNRGKSDHLQWVILHHRGPV